MKGLLLKDFYTITKSLRAFLLIVVILAVMPGTNMAAFAVVYASLLPVTALSYDERCHWERLAAMSPWSSRDIVVSKYLLGYLAIIGACLISP